MSFRFGGEAKVQVDHLEECTFARAKVQEVKLQLDLVIVIETRQMRDLNVHGTSSCHDQQRVAADLSRPADGTRSEGRRRVALGRRWWARCDQGLIEKAVEVDVSAGVEDLVGVSCAGGLV